MVDTQYNQQQYAQGNDPSFDAAVAARAGIKKEGPMATPATNDYAQRAQQLAQSGTDPAQVQQAYSQLQGVAPQTATPPGAQFQQYPIQQQVVRNEQGVPIPTPSNKPPAAQKPEEEPKGTLVGKKSNKNSTQNNLQIAEIRDGLVIMSDGSFRSVVMAQSINFDLMSPQERESVEFAYQNFLNSLYFPVQIFIRSTKINMKPYLNMLDGLKNEQDNMLLALLMEDYTVFINSLVQQTNIMDKSFYVVVSYHRGDETRVLGNNVKKEHFSEGRKTGRDIKDIFKFKNNPDPVTINESDIKEAKAELKNRVSGVVNGLANIGVQTIPLNTEELIELYYDVYNPDTSTRQKLQLSQELMAPVISKGDGDAPRPDISKTY